MLYIYKLKDKGGVIVGSIKADDPRHAAVNLFTDESTGEAFRKMHDISVDALQELPANGSAHCYLEKKGYAVDLFRTTELTEAQAHRLWMMLVDAKVPVRIARVTEKSDKAISVTPRFAPDWWLGGYDTVEAALEGCRRLKLADIEVDC